MNFTEEHVTRKLASELVKAKHEIIAVHPPGGQGPFVIPIDSNQRAIERNSLHPDIVSIGLDSYSKPYLSIAECKLHESDLNSDIEKLQMFSSNRHYMFYAFFRCQLFNNGPSNGFDLNFIKGLDTKDLPIQFVLAARSKNSKIENMNPINSFKTVKYLFSDADLKKS